MSLPRSYPVALVLEPYELGAIRDASLIYDLVADGCIAQALELVDRSSDGGNTDMTLRDLQGVREKMDKAEEPFRRDVIAWMRERGYVQEQDS